MTFLKRIVNIQNVVPEKTVSDGGWKKSGWEGNCKGRQ